MRSYTFLTMVLSILLLTASLEASRPLLEETGDEEGKSSKGTSALVHEVSSHAEEEQSDSMIYAALKVCVRLLSSGCSPASVLDETDVSLVTVSSDSHNVFWPFWLGYAHPNLAIDADKKNQ